MPEIVLVRHGQASFGADDYDQLSELGYQQSRWLGEYFRERGIKFDRVIRGAMKRHEQTADGIFDNGGGMPEVEVHSGFDEFDFHRLLVSYLHHNPDQPVPERTDRKAIYGTLRRAMLAWAAGELEHDLPETWPQFEARVADAVAHAAGDGERVLVVSSGGAISMTLKQVMGFGPETLVSLNLQSRNTGLNHLYATGERLYVTSFNHVPHLDRPDRLDAITHT